MEGHVEDREHHLQRLRGRDTGGLEDRSAQVGGQEWWPRVWREEVRALQEREGFILQGFAANGTLRNCLDTEM